MFQETLDHIDHEQRLYIVDCGNSYRSCIGFEVADRMLQEVSQWTGVHPPVAQVGTLEHYAAYRQAMADGARKYQQTRMRLESELTPQLRGLEGWRVEICTEAGEKQRFIVGKSTGWMPIHLELAKRTSHGGPAVYLPTGATVKRLYKVR